MIFLRTALLLAMSSPAYGATIRPLFEASSIFPSFRSFTVIAPDDSSLATCGDDCRELRLLDAASGALKATLRIDEVSFTDVQFVDAEMVVVSGNTAAANRREWIWTPTNGSLIPLQWVARAEGRTIWSASRFFARQAPTGIEILGPDGTFLERIKGAHPRFVPSSDLLFYETGHPMDVQGVLKNLSDAPPPDANALISYIRDSSCRTCRLKRYLTTMRVADGQIAASTDITEYFPLLSKRPTAFQGGGSGDSVAISLPRSRGLMADARTGDVTLAAFISNNTDVFTDPSGGFDVYHYLDRDPYLVYERYTPERTLETQWSGHPGYSGNALPSLGGEYFFFKATPGTSVRKNLTIYRKSDGAVLSEADYSYRPFALAIGRSTFAIELDYKLTVYRIEE